MTLKQHLKAAVIYLTAVVLLGGANCPGLGRKERTFSCALSGDAVCLQYTKTVAMRANYADDFEGDKVLCGARAGEFTETACSSDDVVGRCTGRVNAHNEGTVDASETVVFFYATPSAEQIAEHCPSEDYTPASR